MPFTTVSITLNTAIGFAVWMSNLSFAAKFILTMILIGKIVLFFYVAWMCDSEKTRKIGSVVLIALNLAIILYSLACKEYYVLVSSAVTLVVFGIWSSATVFDFNFGKKDSK